MNISKSFLLLRPTLLQLVVSGMALGIMAGATGLHWFELRRASPAGSGFADSGQVADRGEQGVLHPVSWSYQQSTEVSEISGSHGSGEDVDSLVAALHEILPALKELTAENQELREQVGEVNRELTEMQFRTDTLSRSFRPLKVTADPPQKIETAGIHPLLPPKHR